MVVYEVKDFYGKSYTPKPKPMPRDIAPAEPVRRVKAIDRFLQRKWKKRNGKKQPVMVALDHDVVQEILNMTKLVNANLKKCGIPINLVLIEENGTYALDIWDCSGGTACKVIHDGDIGFDELPNLLVKLQKEAGIMFDQML